VPVISSGMAGLLDMAVETVTRATAEERVLMHLDGMIAKVFEHYFS
jgi:hypothetical protein